MDNLEGSQRPQGKTFDRIGVSILRRPRRSLGRERSVPKVAWSYWTRAAQHPSSARRYGTACWEAAQHHLMAKRLRIPKMGRIPREIANHQHKRATKRTSRKKGDLAACQAKILQYELSLGHTSSPTG